MYEGEAKIIEVIPETLRDYQTKGLSPEDAAAAFNILFKMENAAGEKFDISLEVSPREGTGKAAGKKQTDMTYSTLVAQRIIASAGPNASEAQKIECIVNAFAADVVGRTVNIYQKESASRDANGNAYVHTYFSNGPRRLPTSEVMERLARLAGKLVRLAGKKVAAPAAPTPTAAVEEDLPF